MYRQSVPSDTPRPSRLAGLCSAFLPLVLGMWFLACCVEVFSLRGHKPIAPVPGAIAVLGAVLGLAWWMGRTADEFNSMNGLGTTLYGSKETPEGRVGTQWIIIAGVPILPVRSYVILSGGEETANWSGAIRTKMFRLRTLDGVYWPQALPILVGVWAALAGLVTLAIVGG